jgi:LDH2 family malate/lactate/ureidoglycolate dehydrogenase
MVDILCAVLSGGKWGPTVDGFTTNKLQAAFAGQGADAADAAADAGDKPAAAAASANGNVDDDEDEEEDSTGIGHFFGAMRIDGFRSPKRFKSTMDDWINAFRNVPPVLTPLTLDSLYYAYAMKIVLLSTGKHDDHFTKTGSGQT